MFLTFPTTGILMLLFSMVDLSLKPVVSLKRATSREICFFFSKQRNILSF